MQTRRTIKIYLGFSLRFDSQASAPKTETQKRWNLVKEHVDDDKKTDDLEDKSAAQDNHAPDIEQGVGSMSFSEDEKDTENDYSGDESKTSGRT
jgi:hypothetical protein